MARKKTKSPPIMSHEFVIQNHADILACVAIVIVVGLISEGPAKISRLFVNMQYGIIETEENSDGVKIEKLPTDYERGILDIFAVVFQAIMLIVVHAVVQEYGIDKISKKFHLSKTKNSRFSESGQLVFWFALSGGYAIHLIIKNKLLPNIASLWDDYPATILSWENKLFMLIQMAYWLHMYPELYFQKVRKDEISTRVQYYTLHLLLTIAAYALHFWKVAIVLMAVHYVAETLFHFSRLCYFAEKTEISKLGFTAWAMVFPTARFITMVVSFLVFWFGLRSIDNQGIDFAAGCYNSTFIRLVCLSAICILQVWLMLPFIQLQLRRRREEQELRNKAQQKLRQQVAKKPAGGKKATNGDVAAGTAKGKAKVH